RRFEPELPAGYLQWVSLGVAAAWLLHPFNLTSVLYVVQRMTSLSAVFCIWGMVAYLWGRIRLHEGRSGYLPILAGLLICAPLAALSKESGALLPLLMLVAEISLFNFQAPKVAARRFLAVFFILTVGIPAAAVLAYVAVHPQWLPATYITRDFNLGERMMTEARVLWFYLRLIIFPSIREMGLFHDDIVISRSLLHPVTTMLSIAGIAALAGLSYLVRKKAPLITFGVLFFLAGHLLESTVLPLEIAHEHRNYLPMFGLLLALFFYLLYPLRYRQNLRIRQAAAVMLVSLFAFGTFARATEWSNPFDLTAREVANHPESARNNGEMAGIYASIETPDPLVMESHYQSARFHYEKAVSLNAGNTHGLFGLIMLSATRGKPVESNWIRELNHRLANAPYGADNGDNLVRMVTCQMQGICKLANGEIRSLLQAPLLNRSATGSNKALALSAFGYYLVNVERDYPAALAAMYQAADYAPGELEHRLTLIKFLIALNRNDEAKAQIAILKRLDTMQAYTAAIESQDKLLAGPNQ
ncbi:MAG: hypothetical protein JWQ23_4183, partial [Herminiimonas sp.]|nr:hypothetical protein [Herminiimonas sp.]